MDDVLSKWFKGDQYAVEFAKMLWTAAQEWDDLEDEGKCKDANGLVSWFAFGKEYHPFFKANSEIMRPCMLQMYLQWRAANTLDRGTRTDVEKSYMLRAGLYSVWHVMAWITGGEEWAVEIGPEIYRSYGETVDQLWSEFNA